MARRPGLALFLALLAAGPAAAQGARVLDVFVTDETGAAVADAALFLHRGGTGAVTDGGGRAQVRPDGADVLVAEAPGRSLAFHHLGDVLPEVLHVTLRPAETTPTRRESFHATRPLDAGLPLGPLGVIAPPSAVVSFDIGPGARGGLVEATYEHQGVDLRVDLVHRATGQRYGFLTGSGNSGNVSFPIPAALARALPGVYDLELRPRDAAFLGAPVDVRVAVDYGPLATKVVEGRPPEVRAPVGTTGRLPNPTMDIVAVRFTNETATGFDAHLLLAAFQGPDAGSALRGVWAVQWESENRTYMVSYVHGRTPSPGVPERFLAGPCVDGVCVRDRLIPGDILPGDPGAIVFHVPKEAVGAPADSSELVAPRGIAFLSDARANTFSQAEMQAFEVDRTPPGSSYRLGVAEFAVPPATFEALRSAAAGGAGASALGGAAGPLVVLVAALGLAAGASALLAGRRRPAKAAAVPAKYEVLRPLGDGASGRTYLARHRELGKLVALKALAGGLGDAEGRARAVREARIAGALRHPNVVEVYDIEEGAEGTRIVMEYVDGCSLQERLDRGLLPLDEALRLWGDILRGLGAIHEAGVVHRDVKPSNVLLASDGTAKLADFGVAHARGEQTLGGSGAPVGTPLYLAPEVLRGHEASPASDLYAATAVAYRMLAGKPHIDVRGATAWEALLDRRGRTVALPAPGLPAWVNDLLRRGLAEEPRRRPPSAAALLADLEAGARRARRGAGRDPPP